MKNSIWTSAAFLAILIAAGCQQTTAPKQEVHPPATGQTAEQRQAANPSAEQPTAGPRSDVDQPDDPGMTTAHDKTPKQEEPSGDESSRAAPNEGDAEPPE